MNVKNDGAAFEGFRIGGVRQIAFAEFFRDDAGFHDCGIEKIPAQHEEAGLHGQRTLERADDLFVQDGGAGAVLADGPAVCGQRLVEQQALFQQLSDDRRHAAGAVEVLAQIFAGGLQIDQQRHVVSIGLPIAEG